MLLTRFRAWSLPFLLVAGAALLVSCSTDSGSAGEACNVSLPTECTTPDARYEDVAPIFERRCASCHGAVKNGPWPLDSYTNIADWADTVRDELVTCTMPPSDSSTGMTNAERRQILDWLRCDYPQ